MKKILVFLIFIYSFGVYAQNYSVTRTQKMTETQYVDSAFGSLDTSRISYKYLLDRVPMNFGHGKFTGLGSIDTIKNTFTFNQIYASIYLSQVNRHPHFTAPLVFVNKSDSEYKASRDTAVPVMVFMGAYNSIDTNAIEAGRILTFAHSVKLMDAGGVNPYDTFSVFAASSVSEKIYGLPGQFYFQFSKDFFATNFAPDAGGAFQVNFNDGSGWHSFSLPGVGSTILQANYTTEGNQTIDIKYTPPTGHKGKEGSFNMLFP